MRLVTSTQGETEDSADCNAFLKGKELQEKSKDKEGPKIEKERVEAEEIEGVKNGNFTNQFSEFCKCKFI